MTDIDLSDKENLLKFIDKEIRKRERWSSSDFFSSQIVAWLSLLASTGTTIWTAVGVGPDDKLKIVAATIAAIPGLMVAVESGFHFSLRSKMNNAAFYDLLNMKYELKNGKSIDIVQHNFIVYMKSLNYNFPVGGAVPRTSSMTVPGQVPDDPADD